MAEQSANAYKFLLGDQSMIIRTARSSRRPPRLAARLRCQVVRERDFRLVADCIINLSARGVLVAPADPVLTGERVIVSFAGSAGTWIDVQATVARVAHGRRRGEHTRSLGLRFDAMDGESEAALQRTLMGRVAVAPGWARERRRNLR